MTTAAHAIFILVTFALWLLIADASLSARALFGIAVSGILAVVPLVLAGRRELDRQPSIERAHTVTSWVYYAFALCMGSAVIAATRFSQAAPALEIPAPPWVGLALIVISSLLLLLVLVNLAVHGLGAPLAVALTRKVASEWFYAYTRNPVVLAALALLVGIGLWMRSGIFLIWVVLIVAPAALLFLVMFEERELEIRFGQNYLDYKARTPRLFPRAPSRK